ncbi:MAG TPA: pyridine nucleotide-disulfide oxidoreductase [Cytophagales bacterium]|nr:pyridine nucleotide-disulfide oxidoreductase [Cytophagales bacterium]HAA22016.1 pyridine nucleotide-disulfide oxidoreductase [Cytophagales bacterium]HAP60094.1 pyridine nucleotide-disulfide oxidoreductase [Cytophagales bacterium]
MHNDSPFEVIILGGSYAGLSAAMALGRSLRKTLIIDGGKPCNRQTPHSHNFLTQDGVAPHEIASIAREQVAEYDTITFVEDFALHGKQVSEGFEIETRSGKMYVGKKLILATGIRDELPSIPGLAECWGISVIHCPYCHGYEYRGQKTGLFANGDHAAHMAPMIRNLTDDLTILTHGPADFSTEQRGLFESHNIGLLETPISEVVHEGGHLRQVLFQNGESLRLDALYAAVPFTQHSAIPNELGCAFTEAGYIQVDAMQKATVEGVYACGDNTTPMRSVANAVASGNIAGAVVNRELVMEQFGVLSH